MVCQVDVTVFPEGWSKPLLASSTLSVHYPGSSLGCSCSTSHEAEEEVVVLSESSFRLSASQSSSPLCFEGTSAIPWYNIISELKKEGLSCDNDVSSSSAFVSSIEAAIESAVADDNWADSGIVELLRGALELAMQGNQSAAWTAAVELLEFHRISENVKRLYTAWQPSSSRTSEPSAPVSTPFAGGEFRVPQKRALGDSADVNPLKRHRTSVHKGCKTHTAKRRSQPSSPELSSKASELDSPARRGGFGGLNACKEGAATVNWQGCIKHKLLNSELELCGLSAHVPKPFAREFAHTLYVSNLTQRKNVLLGRHHVCRCSIKSASENQLAKLRSLAHYELVAVVVLRRGCFILVPYFDNQDNLRVVGFLLSL